MGLPLRTNPIPIQIDADGTARVAGTRVTLDVVVATFQDGATPEEIAQQYPSLSLTDVYEVIGYYLRHRGDVQAYLTERETEASEVRRQNESRFDSRGLRERLLSRRAGAAS